MTEDQEQTKASVEEQDPPAAEEQVEEKNEEAASSEPSSEDKGFEDLKPSPEEEKPAEAQNDTEPAVKVTSPDFESMQEDHGPDTEKANLDLLMDVSIPVEVLLGKTDLLIERALKLHPGSVIKLDRFVGEPLDILINNKRIAQGEVVVAGEHYGVRITKIIEPKERLKGIGGE